MAHKTDSLTDDIGLRGLMDYHDHQIFQVWNGDQDLILSDESDTLYAEVIGGRETSSEEP
jgi:hypothetical protein